MWTTTVTPSAPSTMTRTTTTHANCTSEHRQRTGSCVLCLTDDVSHHIGSSSLSLSSHVIRMSHMCRSLWSLRPPFLLQPVVHRLLPLLCPDAPWHADRPLQPGHRGITCASPPRGATTPTTSPSHSQVMCPTTRSPTSSSTPRVLSPALLRHRTMTLRSASCSPKHTENTPITEVWKVCLSVRRQCLSRPIERGNPWERATSIRQVLVSETRTVLTNSFLQSPKLKKWSIERGNRGRKHWNCWGAR